MNNQIRKTKVVTKNIVADFVAKIQNIFGTNLTSYEKMIEKGTKQIEEELEDEGIKMKWYRYEISQLTNGAIAILFYGDKE